MSEKRSKTYVALVDSIAAHYPTEDLDEMMQALDTAMDDSYEWSKQSDEGDDRREVEGDNLARLHTLLQHARNRQKETP